MQRELELWATRLALLGTPLVFCTLLADAVAAPKLAVLLLALALALTALALRGRAPGLGWLGRLQLIFCAVASLSAMLPGHLTARSWPPLLQMWGVLILYLLWSPQGQDRWGAQARELCGAALAVALYGWIQRFGLDPVGWSYPELSRDLTISTFGNPDFQALYLAVVAPLVWERWVARPSSGLTACGGLLVWLVLILKMLLTLVRSSWLAWICSWLGLAIFFASRRDWKTMVRWLVSTGAVVLALTACWMWQAHRPKDLTSLSQRASLSGKQAESINVRLLLWTGGIRLAAGEPALGCGPAQFSYRFLVYRQGEPEAVRELARVPENAHSQYVQAFAEEGMLAGLVVLTQALLGSLMLARAAWRSPESSSRAYELAAWGALSINLLCLCPDVPASILWAWLMARADQAPLGPTLGVRATWVSRALTLFCAAVLFLWSIQSVVYERLVWLADDDSVLAEQLVRKSQRPPLMGAAGEQQQSLRAQAFGDEVEASLGYQRARGWAPAWKTGEAWDHLSLALVQGYELKNDQLGLLRSALEANHQALLDTPQNPHYWARRAAALTLLWRTDPTAFKGAIDCWVEALARDPYNAPFHFELARLLWMGQLRDNALQELQASLTIAPHYKDALELRTQILQSPVQSSLP